MDWARKAVTALVGAAGEAVTLGLVTATWGKWLAVGIAFATALGVYVVPNATPAPPPPK